MLRTDICICTRNRPDDLRRCIESVLNSEIAVNNVIVSDDSTDDRTRHLIERDFPGVQWIDGPHRGLGANRNRAIAAVKADFVIFLDDDAALHKNFISAAYEFGTRQSIDFKNTILTGVEINNGRQVRSSDQNFLGFQQRKYGDDDTLNTIVINSALIPAEVARTIRFDELLVYGFDEVDFAMRARVGNVKIAFCPEMMNFHFPSSVNRDFYSPFTDSSRIYVTFKRYVLLERNRSKACLYLGVASLHLLVTNVRRLGPRGIPATWRSLKKAYGFKQHFLAQQNYANLRPGS